MTNPKREANQTTYDVEMTLGGSSSAPRYVKKSRYGSLVFFRPVSESGMKGGLPPVVKYVIGMGKAVEAVYCMSRLASTPAAAKDWLFKPPFTEATVKLVPRPCGNCVVG